MMNSRIALLLILSAGLSSGQFGSNYLNGDDDGDIDDGVSDTGCFDTGENCHYRVFYYTCSGSVGTECRRTCGFCTPAGSAANTSPQLTQQPITQPQQTQQPFVGRQVSPKLENLEATFGNFKQTVEERLVNISLILNGLEGKRKGDDQKFLAIIQIETSTIKKDIEELKARPVYNGTFAVTASQVNLLVDAKLQSVRSDIKDIQTSLREMKKLLTPTVEVTCTSNGDVSYSQKYIAVCPGNCDRIQNFAWGTGTYTSDSYLCGAAIHDGKINAKYGGQVTVKRIAGRDTYVGSTRNNITSADHGKWRVSFQFEI